MSTPNPATTPWVPLWDLNGGVNLDYKGAYVAATQYKDGDVVIYQGATYMCVRPTTNAPSIAPPAWPMPAADTAWHRVGQSGEPAFQNGWSTWDAAGGRDVCFRKLANGIVLLKGIAKAPASGPIGTSVFTLPVGYRVKASAVSGPIDIYFPAVMATAAAVMQIMENGAVNLASSVAAAPSNWLDLSGISFLAEL